MRSELSSQPSIGFHYNVRNVKNQVQKGIWRTVESKTQELIMKKEKVVWYERVEHITRRIVPSHLEYQFTKHTVDKKQNVSPYIHVLINIPIGMYLFFYLTNA